MENGARQAQRPGRSMTLSACLKLLNDAGATRHPAFMRRLIPHALLGLLNPEGRFAAGEEKGSMGRPSGFPPYGLKSVAHTVSRVGGLGGGGQAEKLTSGHYGPPGRMPARWHGAAV